MKTIWKIQSTARIWSYKSILQYRHAWLDLASGYHGLQVVRIQLSMLIDRIGENKEFPQSTQLESLKKKYGEVENFGECRV